MIPWGCVWEDGNQPPDLPRALSHLSPSLDDSMVGLADVFPFLHPKIQVSVSTQTKAASHIPGRSGANIESEDHWVEEGKLAFGHHDWSL